VAGHDDPHAGRARVDVERLQVVDRIQRHRPEVDAGRLRDRTRPRRRVVVAADNRQRGNGRQALENRRTADIARVDDMVGPGKKVERFGPQQAVRVGNQADPHRFSGDGGGSS
jgi:hypothetical protein